MTAPQSFRSAFNGFNREDVVHYIEYINANHTAKVNQLMAEIDSLRTQLDSVQPDDGAQERCAQLELQLKEQQAANESLRAELEQKNAAPVQTVSVENPLNAELSERCASLERQLQAAMEARVRAESERDSAKEAAAQRLMQQELEAYRRAERLERVAKERSEQVYRLANGALADATVKVDEAFSQIGELTDQVSAQLLLLEAAVTGSKQALADAATTLYAIRPECQE